jgi:DNA-binding CsgD family transcriptional regulator
MEMIGRRSELAALQRGLACPPALVVVTGVAGVGKTRLVDEALRTHQGTVLHGRCHGGPDPFPLGPIADVLAGAGPALPPAALLSPLTGVLAPLVPEIAPLLPPPPATAPAAARHQLFRAIRALLASLGPTALVIDDAQHLDPQTAQLLRFLTADPLPGLGILLSLRPGPAAKTVRTVLAGAGDRMTYLAVNLTPLAADDVRELVEAVAQADVSAAFAEELCTRTRGLPLLVVELARALKGGPDLAAATHEIAGHRLDGSAVPARLRDKLLADLPPTVRAERVLKAAALFGGATSHELLRAVSRLSARQTAAAIAECVATETLIDDGVVTVSSPLLRRVVYESIGAAERRLLHTRAVKALDRADPKPLRRLATHARLAGDLRGWRCYVEMAADQAMAHGEAAVAARMLREVLAAPAPPREVAGRLARKLAVASVDGLSHHDTVAALTNVLAGPDLPTATRGELRLHLGLLLVNQLGQVTAGRREIELALPDLHDAPALSARALSALAVPMWPQGTIEQHLSWMAQAADAAAVADDPALVTAVQVNRVTTLLNTGDPAGRRALTGLPADGRSQAETAHLARGACSHANAAGWLGHYRLADDLIRRAERLARQSSADFAGSITAVTRLRLDWCCGRWEGLAQRAAHMMREAADVPPVALEARLVLGLIRLAQGEVGTAIGDLSTAARLGNPDAAIPVTVTASGSLAQLQLSNGNRAAALTIMDAAVALVRDKENWVWLADVAPLAVEIYLACGRAGAAVSLVGALSAGLTGRDTPLQSPALAACEARLLAAEGRIRPAVAAHHRAARHYASLPQPYAVARELAAAGSCLLDSDRERGGQLVTRALNRFDRLGATWDAGRSRSTLREHGIIVAHRRGRRGYGDSLSPRETEVAKLAAGGLSNRDIARALFLSERTVEDHISRAMRKTQVTSRHALPVTAHDAAKNAVAARSAAPLRRA